MGVYIPNTEMPRNCWECRLCDWNETDDKSFGELFCEITGKKIETEYKALSERLTDCPLVEVKTPHGRLIDAKAFETKNKYFWHRDFINAKSEDALCDLFDDAPTIIEAEGKDDG